MSHLLYLHAFRVDRFVDVFGGGKTANIERLLKYVQPNAAKSPPAHLRALVTRAINQGLDGKASKGEQLLLDAIVERAITTRSFGVATAPISPTGVGGSLFDAFDTRFAEAGATAKRLFELLQRGRNYEGGIVLLSPNDVQLAAKLLKNIAEQQDAEDADEMDEVFIEELVQPFVATAKKGRAVFGHWT